MASAKELREMITRNREALVEAIAGASSRWDSGGENSPRQIAEAAARAEVERASKAAAVLGGNPLTAPQWDLTSAESAAEALRKLGPEVDKRFSWAEDRDLSKTSEGMTLEQIMTTHAGDLSAHAERVRAG